jgi:hypothetical protein
MENKIAKFFNITKLKLKILYIFFLTMIVVQMK